MAQAPCVSQAILLAVILSECIQISGCAIKLCPLLPEDGHLNFTEFASKYGLPHETHEVITEDGYMLTLFRIPGDKTRPVLLMHGVLDTADTYILRGNASMAATLSREGYDVWAGNTRGNRYARKHVRLDPNSDKEYWNFSFHEIGMYDLPAKIDYILNITGQARLSYIGHSQGNTIFFVMGSMRPEYNDKIKLQISMSPVSNLYHLREPAKYFAEAWPFMSTMFEAFGQDEVFNDNSIETNLFKATCCSENSYDICGRGIILALAGKDVKELEPEFLPVIVGHYPSGTSRKSGDHLFQSSFSNRFSQMDYGVTKNLMYYNSTTPPDYDLSKVTMKIALLAAVNDGMCSLTDVEMLRKQLPNVVELHVMKWSPFNHVDYVWGRNMRKHLFPKVLSLLERFQ